MINMNKKLDEIYKKSKRIRIDDTTKIVIMSDCHRGAGDNFDNFIKNKNIFDAALNHYYNRGFTYIELGDGDDMWEVKKYNEIILEHISSFKLLKKFNDSNRLIMIYGNHDISKRNNELLKEYFYKYYNSEKKEEEELLNNLVAYESIVLEYKNKDIFMVHGHQVDLLNGTFWYLSCFLVRHLWKHFERFGIKDPTNAAKNYEETKRVEKRLKKWSIKNRKMLITGHTHRPVFPKIGESLYFNDGSCIHPNGISCIEIENGNISLVKWVFKLKKENLIFIDRVVVEGKESILSFF